MKRAFDLPRRKNSIAVLALRKIADMMGDQDRVVLPWLYRYGAMYRELEAELSRLKRGRRIRDALRQLKRQHFIEIRKIGNQMELVLTNKGVAVDLIEKMKTRPSRGDNRLLLVSFDIPEQERVKRNLFTRQLKYAGFKKMHASLWSSDKNIQHELLRLLKLMRAGKWVRVYAAKERPLE